MEAAERSVQASDAARSQSTFSVAGPLVDDETYVRIVDPACSECDDGGTVFPCDGHCLRAFHLGLDEKDRLSSESGPPEFEFNPKGCNPLAMPEDLARRLNKGKDTFQCPNCLLSVQQCYSCKKEGNSDLNCGFGGDTVARCAVFDCGKYYHPRCIVTPKYPQGLKSDHLESLKFICPQHICALEGTPNCKADKSKKTELIKCRRCPISYHIECIPRSIQLTAHKKRGKRIWIAKGRDEEGNHLGDPVDRSLIYCTQHKIPPKRENPMLEAPLFTKELLSSWRTHYSKLNLDLPSSVEWLRKNPRWKPVKSFFSPVPSATPARPPAQRLQDQPPKALQLPTAAVSEGEGTGNAGDPEPASKRQKTGEASGKQPARRRSRELTEMRKTEQKARLDCLYKLLSEAGAKEIKQPGYCTLTRQAFDNIFNRLMKRHGLTETSQLIDLGAGWGKALWHAAVSVGSLEALSGVEEDDKLVSEGERISRHILANLPRAMSESTPCFQKPCIRKASLQNIGSHDSATHMLLHWEGLTKESRESAGRIFSSSPKANVLVVIHAGKIVEPEDRMKRLGFGDLECKEKLTSDIQVQGTKEARTAYIFQKTHPQSSS